MTAAAMGASARPGCVSRRLTTDPPNPTAMCAALVGIAPFSHRERGVAVRRCRQPDRPHRRHEGPAARVIWPQSPPDCGTFTFASLIRPGAMPATADAAVRTPRAAATHYSQHAPPRPARIPRVALCLVSSAGAGVAGVTPSLAGHSATAGVT